MIRKGGNGKDKFTVTGTTKKNTATAAKKKVLRFDRSEARLMESIEMRLEEGDFLTALKLSHRRRRAFGDSLQACSAEAEAYEALEVNTNALRAWYRFLSMCDSDNDSLADAYEGIAVNYMNLNRETQAAYYYNLLLQADPDISDETKMDIVETFAKPPKNPFKLVYPPEQMDYGEEFDSGMQALREGKFQKAREEFSKVYKGSKQYKAAKNMTAISYLLEDNTAEAERISLELLEEEPEDVQANTTYAAVLGQRGEKVKAREVALKLATMSASGTDELYKIATVCCENDLHEEAYQKFIQLEEELANDKTLLYFKAVAAYKSGRLDESINTFQKLLTIYPQASTARYYHDVLRYYRENQDKTDVFPPELTYYYVVPPVVREHYTELLLYLKKIKYGFDDVTEDPQLSAVLDWCFEESEGADLELQELAIDVVLQLDMDDYLQKVLLDPFVADIIKVDILTKLAKLNRPCAYALNICHIFSNIEFTHISVGVKKRKKFLDGYASVYAKFAVLSKEHGKRITAAAELVYRCLESADMTLFCDHVEDISALIYLVACIKEGGGKVKNAVDIFEADQSRVVYLLETVQRITKEIIDYRNGNGTAGSMQEDGQNE